jgi:hypothetical protein
VNSVWPNDAIPSARGWRAVREIHDAVFAEADPPHGEEAAEHLRERSSSAKRDRLLWGKTGRSMMGLSSGDEDGHVGSPEQTLSRF